MQKCKWCGKWLKSKQALAIHEGKCKYKRTNRYFDTKYVPAFISDLIIELEDKIEELSLIIDDFKDKNSILMNAITNLTVENERLKRENNELKMNKKQNDL